MLITFDNAISSDNNHDSKPNTFSKLLDAEFLNKAHALQSIDNLLLHKLDSFEITDKNIFLIFLINIVQHQNM